MASSPPELCYLCSSPVTLRYPATTKPEEESYAITENRTGRHGNLSACPRCGLWMLSKAEREAFAAIPSKPDPTYLEEETGRRKASSKVLERIERLTTKGKILDIGSSAGFFLAEAKSRGWETTGIEFSSWSKEYAQKLFGLAIYDQPLGKLNWRPESFDAVTMLDVIEHLTDPRQVLTEVGKILKPNGVFVLTTPNIDGLAAKLAKEKWYAILPGHLFYFSPETLEKILAEAGFHVVKKKTHTRYFSAAYFFYRLGGYLSFMEKLGKSRALKKLMLPLNFGDQLEWYVKKSG
jgi:2-polyprenyl-3-methyl-5-hydroxy-6-metoxy-1,4-benzoquinol methylase